MEALIRFHNRRIESLRSALRKEKRFKSSKPNRKGTVNYKATVGRKTPSETVTAETVKKAEKTIEELQEIVSLYKANKEKKDYTCLLTDSHTISKGRVNTKPSRVRSKTRKTRRKNNRIDRLHTQTEANKEHIKNLSNVELTTDQINLLAKGLKFIPTPKEKEIQIRRQLLKDFDQFSRRMRLQYIFNGETNEPHPFHVKSGWIPPVQPSVALESYLEETRVLLAETQFTKPKNNLFYAEQKAVETLRKNTNINLKKADKGTRTVVLNTEDKIQEGQVQLDNIEHYRPLESAMVEETSSRVKLDIRELHQNNHIDDMTNQWLCQTPNPPRIPVFYTLTKIHKPSPVGRPIISGCDGPTERLSSFVDRLL